MATRQKYTVLIPFPLGLGHWSTAGQELELLHVEASAWRSAGRLELSSVLEAQKQAAAAAPVAADAVIAPTKAPKATAKKAE